jgi:acetyltransferase-like isoleucine patch superfamily enzyme
MLESGSAVLPPEPITNHNDNPKMAPGNLLQRLLQKVAYGSPGGGSLRPWLHRLRGVNVGENVWIGQQVYIDDLHPDAVTIEERCTIGMRTSIFTHFYWGPRRSKEHAGPVVIEANAYIGPHCVILPNVRIGRGAVIKAGSVVSRNVPPGTLWGTPAAEPLARVTIPLTSERSYDEFLRGLRPLPDPGQTPKVD